MVKKHFLQKNSHFRGFPPSAKHVKTPLDPEITYFRGSRVSEYFAGTKAGHIPVMDGGNEWLDKTGHTCGLYTG